METNNKLVNSIGQGPPGQGKPASVQANQTSQESVISSNDEFHWCADADYHLASDHSYQSNSLTRGNYDHATSEISFTSNSDPNSPIRNERYINKNFDIHLAQIDIDTFRSEDIERITHSHNRCRMDNSADTLRIVESIKSLNAADKQSSQHLQPPNEDYEAISLDSLDLSLDNEINAQLIQKCSERDKTRYKIAMIETSTHSQMHNSSASCQLEYDYASSVNNNCYNYSKPSNISYLNHAATNESASTSDTQFRVSNPFLSSVPYNEQSHNAEPKAGVEMLQSPGSLVQMFMQRKGCSNENSFLDSAESLGGNYVNYSLSKCDTTNCNGLLGRQVSNERANYPIEEIDESSAGNSLNTVDSNELPLHVLDLSKKLRSMGLGKPPLRPNSSSVSSNTSYASTTSSSAATTGEHRRRAHSNQTNPFLQNPTEERSRAKNTRTTSTQFPEMFQDKEVQASFDEDPSETPVLVYYPNYSLPDLSFLKDIFKHEPAQNIYLSPVKHELPKLSSESSTTGGVTHRQSNSNVSKAKSRPKSYADYETLLNQDFSHIEDWDSLNLLLPDDFKDYIEKNNMIRGKTTDLNDHQPNQNTSPVYPIKTITNSRALQNVKLRSQQRYRQPTNKRYSLQEATFNTMVSPIAGANCPNYANTQNYANHQYYANYPNEMNLHMANGTITRSQTMPNCGIPGQFGYPTSTVSQPSCGGNNNNPFGGVGHCLPSSNNHYHHNCCHPCHSCHSNCHSPSFHSSQSSPQKPNHNLNNFSWEQLSSSSFKKLLSFLSKLDEYSSEHSTTSPRTESRSSANSHQSVQTVTRDQSINESKSVNIRPTKNASSSANYRGTVKPTTKLEQKSKIASNSVMKCGPPLNSTKVTRCSKATSPITATGQSNIGRRSAVVPPEKAKIILKRPNTLKSGVSSIPVPKRSMIPIPNTLPGCDAARTKEARRLKNGVGNRF